MELLNRINKVIDELTARMGDEIYMIRLCPDFSGDIGFDTPKDFHKEVEFDNLDGLLDVLCKYEKLMNI